MTSDAHSEQDPDNRPPRAPRRARGASAALFGACLGLALAACGRPAPTGLVLGPGDSLFEHVDHVRVVERAPTNLPAPLAGRSRETFGDLGERIAPEDWRGPDVLPENIAAWCRGRRMGEVKLWSVVPAQPLDRPFSKMQLEYDGAPIRGLPKSLRATLMFFPLKFAWWFPPTRSILWWDAPAGQLKLITAVEPAELRVTFLETLVDELAAFEPALRKVADVEASSTPRPTTPRPAVSDATAPDTDALDTDAMRPYATRLALAEVDRRVWAVGTPSVLEIDVARLEATWLDVAVGVAERGLVEVDGLLRRAPGASDGVTFAVELQPLDDPEAPLERVWSTHAEPAAAYEEVRVDLSHHRGRAVRIRLVTEPGGHADFDHAVWSGLRVGGDDAVAPERPHVVIIDVDTLRADRLGVYGAERATSPNIDVWAERSAIVYTDALATSSWTLPSTASMLTGLAVQQHGAADQRPYRPLTEDARALAVRLRELGYETYASTDGGFVGPTFGFQHGFDVYDFRREEGRWQVDPGWGPLLERLRARGSPRPVFVFLHTFMVHDPYLDDLVFESEDEPYTGPLQGRPIDHFAVLQPFRHGKLELDAADRAYVSRLYDAGVRRMDEAVGRALEALREAFGDDPALIVFTSDHGEELFDHESVGHGHSLYGELLDVPLIIEYPVGEAGVDDRAASLIDLVPTVLDVIGAAPDPTLPGRSLLAPATLAPRIAQQRHDAHAVQFDAHKLILPIHDEENEHELQLYRLSEDPEERVNVVEAEPERRAALERMLEQFLVAHPPIETSSGAERDVVPDAVLEDLRELGYVGDH